MPAERSLRRALLPGTLALAGLAWWLALGSDASRPHEASPAVQAGTDVVPGAPALLESTLLESTLLEPAPVPVAVPETPAPEGAQRVAREPLPAAPGSTPFDALDANEGLLQVRVLALESGLPLAGVPLRLEALAGVGLARVLGPGAVTDDEGRADLRVPARQALRLHAAYGEPPGRSASRAIAPLEPRQYKTAVLEVFGATDRSWCACVVDGVSGVPVEDALVSLGLLEVRSAADGFVCLELGGTRELQLRVASEEHLTRTLPIEYGHPSRAEAQLVELYRCPHLLVEITDAAGAPLSGVPVSWVRAQAGPRISLELGVANPDGPGKAETDAEGRCVFTDVPIRVPLVVRCERSAPRLAELEALQPGETRRVRWTLGTGCTLTGRVVDQDGRAAAGAPLWLLPDGPGRGLFSEGIAGRPFRSFFCDAAGAFRFEDVAPGAWRLGPSPTPQWPSSGGVRPPEESEQLAPLSMRFELAPGERERDLSLQAWRGLFVRGQLVDGAGAPLRKAMPLFASWNEQQLRGRSDADGAFAFGPLPPGELVLPENPPRSVPVGSTGVQFAFYKLGKR